MLDERRTLSPVPVVTTLPPDVSDLVANAERLGVQLQPWQEQFLQNLMAEEEHRSLDDLPKPTFQWDTERKPDLLSPLIYGAYASVVDPRAMFISAVVS